MVTFTLAPETDGVALWNGAHLLGVFDTQAQGIEVFVSHLVEYFATEPRDLTKVVWN
jgi:hypothetical protein